MAMFLIEFALIRLSAGCTTIKANVPPVAGSHPRENFLILLLFANAATHDPHRTQICPPSARPHPGRACAFAGHRCEDHAQHGSLARGQHVPQAGAAHDAADPRLSRRLSAAGLASLILGPIYECDPFEP